MKWLVLNTLGDKLLPFGYETSIRIAHVLNIHVASIGIDEDFYSLEEDSKKFDFNTKMDLLLNISRTSPQYDSYNKIIQDLKQFNKLKNKSSKLIGAYSKMKAMLLKIYEGELGLIIENGNTLYSIKELNKLVNKGTLYFYNAGAEKDLKDYPDILTINQILQLILPDPEKGNPLFFLNLHNFDEYDFSTAQIYKSDSKEAEKKGLYYADESLIFPNINILTDVELDIAKKELDQKSKEFKDKIEQWAQICYDNPNSNKGLEYFRKNIKKMLASTKNLPEESAVIKNNAITTFNRLQSQILIGELPIDLIWMMYYKSDVIDEETYDSLLKIKAEQTPKFDGRWPVVIFKCIDKNVEFTKKPETTSEPEVTSIRKTISLD